MLHGRHLDSFEKNLLPMLVQRNIGILGMKPMGDANILRSGIVTPLEGLHYSMSLPTSVVITGCDSMQILERNGWVRLVDLTQTF